MDDFKPHQQRGLELMSMLVPICNGADANAVSCALTIMHGAVIGKNCRTEAEVIKMSNSIASEIARNALDFLDDRIHDA